MRVFYAGEPLPDATTCSVFLMGSSLRADRGPAEPWRPAALRELADRGFRGEVFVPESRDGNCPADDTGLPGWEDAALRRTDRILAWVPGDAADPSEPATADEWVYWAGRDPARLVLGIPPGVAHARHRQAYAQRFGVPVVGTLAEACAAAADAGEDRRGGECEVPLHVWRTASFQNWYAAQRAAGNVLHGAAIEWVFRVRDGAVLFWALRVDVYVAAENRRKTNEVVVGRPDVSAVVLYRPGPDLLGTEVVLVREFRSPAATADGYVWELPSGSTSRPGRDPVDTAAEEVAEEVGLRLPRAAFRPHGARQVAGTISTHRAHVFSAELTPAQVAELRAREAAGTPYGLAEESERTFVRVRTLKQILDETPADWATLGVILSVLRECAGLGGGPPVGSERGDVPSVDPSVSMQ